MAPSYEDVKADTISAGEEIIATFPAPVFVELRPDEDPHPCDSGGHMYTGQWSVTLPEDTDVPGLINALPDVLGENWAVTRGSVPRADDYVDTSDTARNVGVSVTDYSSMLPAPTIEVLATSACGTGPVSSGS